MFFRSLLDFLSMFEARHQHYKVCQQVTTRGSKVLIEEEASILGSFNLQCFDDLIDVPEVWKLIEMKVQELVHSYSPLLKHNQLGLTSKPLKNNSQFFKPLTTR